MSDIFTPEQQEQLRDFYDTLRLTTEHLKENPMGGKTALEQAAEQAQKNLNLRSKKLRENFDLVGQGANELYNSLNQVSGGQQKYAKSLQSLTQGVGSLVMMLGGPFAKVVGTTIIAFGKLTEGVLKQNDALISAYQEIGKYGGVLNTSTEGLLNLAIQAGYSSKNIETFGKAAVSVAPELVALGGSVSQGIKKFSQLAAVTDEQLAQFLRLGITQDQLLQSQADYVAFQTRTGRTLTKDNSKLREETLRYTEYLVDLANITGSNLDQQKRSQEAMANDVRYQIKIRMLEEQGTEESLKRAKRLQDAYQYFMEVMPPEQAKAMASIAATGNIIGEEQAAIFRGSRGQVVEFTSAMMNGTISAQEVAKRYKETQDKNIRDLGETFIRSDAAIRDFALNSTFFAKRQIIAEGKSLEDARKERETKQRQSDDKRIEAERQRLETERKVRQASDEFFQLVSNLVNPAFQALLTPLEALANAANKVLRFFNRLVGDDIRTAEEGQAALQKLRQDRQDIDRQMKKIEEARPKDYLQDKEYIALAVERNKKLREEKELVDITNKFRKEEAETIKQVQESQYEQAKKNLDLEKVARIELQREGASLTQKNIDARVDELKKLLTKTAEGTVDSAKIVERKLKDVKIEVPKEIVGADPRSLSRLSDTQKDQIAKFQEQQTRTEYAKKKIEEIEQENKYLTEKISKLKKDLDEATKQKNEREKERLTKEIKDLDKQVSQGQSKIITSRNQYQRELQKETVQKGLLEKQGVSTAALATRTQSGQSQSAGTSTGAIPIDVANEQKGAPPVLAPFSIRTIRSADLDDASNGSQTQSPFDSKSSQTSGIQVPEKPITDVVDAGPGFTTVKTSDGDKQKRIGVRNWRNNNPGNLEFGNFTKAMGAVGTDGRFAVFKTLDDGMKAKEKLLFGENSGYIGLSIRDAINRYAPPHENDTEMYISRIVQSIGTSADSMMKDLSQSQRDLFLQTVNRVEGFKVGKILQAEHGMVVSARPGGTLVNVAEAGKNEALIPLKNNKIPVDIRIADDNSVVGNLVNRVAERAVVSALDTIPGVKEFKKVLSITDAATKDTLSTDEKIFEIVKLLNPQVAMLSKAYDIISNREEYISKIGTAVNMLSDSIKTNMTVAKPDLDTLITSVVQNQEALKNLQVANQNNVANSPPAATGDSQITKEMVDLLASKFDAFNSKLEESNSIQSKILQQART